MKNFLSPRAGGGAWERGYSKCLSRLKSAHGDRNRALQDERGVIPCTKVKRTCPKTFLSSSFYSQAQQPLCAVNLQVMATHLSLSHPFCSLCEQRLPAVLISYRNTSGDFFDSISHRDARSSIRTTPSPPQVHSLLPAAVRGTGRELSSFLVLFRCSPVPSGYPFLPI